ncbi:MAG TPA: chemotaxis protein CheC [Candidatus Wunengus sp. YC60]|uniref:chemotaxis protein CheC n=1 Tax=Candidatus Wunengus sp. YC60 TaxID=3367697 RepID=UPI0040255EE9
MSTNELLSEEQMDFLREMVNIGAGNAADAFSQMLHTTVDLSIPDVYIFPSTKPPPFLKDPAVPFAGTSMEMVGDVRGRLFFLVLDEQKNRLIGLIEKAMPGGENRGGVGIDLSVLEELANILAGVFLVSIHDFCRLNVYHSVPDLKTDMIQSLIEESIAGVLRETAQIILIESSFVIVGENIRTYFLIVPDLESTRKLVTSIEDARKEMYGNEED